tara:strand:- start:116 stop:1354 length:1239 start_codon:yes stop_codon:yes gene_type:complete
MVLTGVNTISSKYNDYKNDMDIDDSGADDIQDRNNKKTYLAILSKKNSGADVDLSDSFFDINFNPRGAGRRTNAKLRQTYTINGSEAVVAEPLTAGEANYWPLIPGQQFKATFGNTNPVTVTVSQATEDEYEFDYDSSFTTEVSGGEAITDNTYSPGTTVTVSNDSNWITILLGGGTGEGGSIGGNGGSSGDPYCEPIFGNPIKLPNKYANYRLFESQDLYINATVSAATKQDKANIIDYLQQNHYSQNVIEHAIYDGFFYDTFYISYKGASIKMDMNTLQKEIVNKDFFTETISPITNQLSIIKEEQGKQIEYTFNHELHGKVKIMIQLYNNPQVKNGIVINLENNASQAMGMLVYNYKPKYMVIPTVTTLYYKKLHNRLIKDTKKSKNIYKEQKTLVEKNEVWVKKKLNF